MSYAHLWGTRARANVVSLVILLWRARAYLRLMKLS